MRTPKLLRIPSDLRNILILILSVILVISMIFTSLAFSQKTTVKKSIPVVTYWESGEFDYLVHLKNNSLYEKPTLEPGEGVIFKRLVESINASFTYKFWCNRSSTIAGSYGLIAVLSTDLWEKEYTLLPTTTFSSEEPANNISFRIEFPINFSKFEGILSKINSETGVVARNPRIIYRCMVSIDAGKVKDVFAPELNVTLSGDIIGIENLHSHRKGVVKESKVVQKEDVKASRGLFLILDIISILALSFLLLFSEGIAEENKTLKLIRRRYSDLLVEVKNLPALERKTKVNTLDDLIKLSDILGKPIFYRKSARGYQLAVIDDGTGYFLFVEEGESPQ